MTRRVATFAVAMPLFVAACSMAEPDGDGGPAVTFATLAPTSTAAHEPDTSDPAATTTLVPPSDRTVTFTTVASRLTHPVDVAWRSGDDTMYVAQQPGTVVPVRDGRVGTPVLDLSQQVSLGVEQGLLGLTFSNDGRFAYTDHTDLDGDTVITEFPVADDGTFVAASSRVLLTVDQPYDNHNGGNVLIGADDMLYIGMGDGGAGGDPDRLALDVSSLLGKILRIDPTPDRSRPYTIPVDNPFVGVDGARAEIWSVGLRNPWRFSFDSETGDLWIGDVGQDLWEEIDAVASTGGQLAGRAINFGWSASEGTHRFNDDQSTDGVTPPVYEYAHSVEVGCSVTGGAVYRGTAVAALAGWYVYADFCSGDVFALHTTPGAAVENAVWVTIDDLQSVSTVRAAPDGELYVLDYAVGTLSIMQPA